MTSIQLEDQEWQTIIQVLSTAPWNVANPLLAKIGQQIRNQVESQPPAGIRPIHDILKPQGRRKNAGGDDATPS